MSRLVLLLLLPLAAAAARDRKLLLDKDGANSSAPPISVPAAVIAPGTFRKVVNLPHLFSAPCTLVEGHSHAPASRLPLHTMAAP